MRFHYKTKAQQEVLNVTDDVQKAVTKSGIEDGLVLISVIGSTAAVSTIEYEPALVKDQQALVEKLISSEKDYAHNKTWGDGNGFSHLRATLYSPSLTLPVEENKLVVGTWQQVVLLEFDNKSRTRELIVKVIPSGNK